MATEVPKTCNMTSQQVIDYYRSVKPSTIIVNGGDPFMMPPSFYEDILREIETGETRLALVSNLLGLYTNPEKWKSIVLHPSVNITTSFQYGNARRIDKDTPYTEEIFRKVYKKCTDLIGYKPLFISVIDYDNAGTMIKTARLAKELDCKCRINPAKKIGASGYSYPLWKYYKELGELYKSEYALYEANCLHIHKGEFLTKCPVTKTCHRNIRGMTVFDYASCPSMVIHPERIKDFKLNLKEEMETGRLCNANNLVPALRSECYGCELYEICNNCDSTKLDIKEAVNNKEYTLDEHCDGMKRDAIWIVS